MRWIQFYHMGQKFFKEEINLKRWNVLANCKGGGNYEEKGIPGRTVMGSKHGDKTRYDIWRSINNSTCRKMGCENLEKK